MTWAANIWGRFAAALHARWAHLRHHGEWFKATPELFAEIDAPVFDSTRAAA